MGGRPGGWHHSPDTKERIRQARVGAVHHPVGQRVEDVLAWCKWYLSTYSEVPKKIRRAKKSQ